MKTKNIDAAQIQEEILAIGISELTSNVNLNRVCRGQHRIHRRALQRSAKPKESDEKKTYDVLVVYSKPNYPLVKKAFPDQRWLDGTHTWFMDIDMDEVNKIKESLKSCVVSIGGEEFKIRICVYRHCVKIATEQPKIKKASNNTPERKKSAQNARKAANLKRHANAHAQAVRRNTKKAEKKAVNHSSGSNLTSQERKFQNNLKKAVKCFTKQQLRTVTIKAEKKHFKNSKQLQLDFKAAA